MTHQEATTIATEFGFVLNPKTRRYERGNLQIYNWEQEVDYRNIDIGRWAIEHKFVRTNKVPKGYINWRKATTKANLFEKALVSILSGDINYLHILPC
jgi:nickel-dependent lactate racemase